MSGSMSIMGLAGLVVIGVLIAGAIVAALYLLTKGKKNGN